VSKIEKESQETLENKTLNKHSNMSVYECTCGLRILVTPDLPEMARAIKLHLVVHKKLTGNSLSERALTEEILKVLITNAIF
jgi:hypothetical protein